MGKDLISTNSSDGFGYSLQLSRDGFTLAVGSPGSDARGPGSGKVQVFDLQEL